MSSRLSVAIRTYAAISAALCLTAAAYADVVVVVGTNSSIKTLTKEQVAAIYLAKKPFICSDGEEAMPLDLYEGNALHNEFYNKVTGRSPAQLKAYWTDVMISGLKAARPTPFPDSSAVKNMVVMNPHNIGIISNKEVDGSVRVVFAP